MGLLDALLGNASEVDISEVAEELAPIIGDTESIQQVFKVVRDMYVFTNKRLILIDKQGMTGRKVDYHSIPSPTALLLNLKSKPLVILI